MKFDWKMIRFIADGMVGKSGVEIGLVIGKDSSACRNLRQAQRAIHAAAEKIEEGFDDLFKAGDFLQKVIIKDSDQIFDGMHHKVGRLTVVPRILTQEKERQSVLSLEQAAKAVCG